MLQLADHNQVKRALASKTPKLGSLAGKDASVKRAQTYDYCISTRPKITMDKEIYKISKRSLRIRPLSMGVKLPGYAAPMRHNDPSSMKRHLPPLKTKDF